MNKKIHQPLTISDKDLLSGCLQGLPSAQKALYEQYKIPLFRVCLRYAKDQPEAEDMLQDGFIKIFADLHQYKGKGALGGWMRKVVVNVILQHLRKNKNFKWPVDLEDVSDQRQYPAMAHANLNAQELTTMIQQLPLGYKTVFNLYVIEGYSHQEIAKQLNINVNTSKSQLSKAKATLRTMIRKSEHVNLPINI